MRNTTTAVLAGILVLAPAATASAHITANPSEAPSDSYATVRFDVGHGCEGSPTTQLKIKVPPSVASATPAVHPLWNVTTKEGRKTKVELHGETITRGVSEVTYTAKKPLPSDRLDFFNLSVKLPAGKPGETRGLPDRAEVRRGRDPLDPGPGRGRESRRARGSRAGDHADRGREDGRGPARRSIDQRGGRRAHVAHGCRSGARGRGPDRRGRRPGASPTLNTAFTARSPGPLVARRSLR